MSLFNNAIIGASGQGGYQISRSVRQRASASAFFSKSFASAGSRTTWTMSFWVKLGDMSAGFVMCAGAGTGIGVDVERIYVNSGNGIYWQRAIIQTSTTYNLQTNAVFRDPASWYHVVLVWDSNNATVANRWSVYVNGVKQNLSTQTAIGSGQTSLINSTSAWKINRTDDQTSSYGDNYLTEVNFIDGQALTPSSFGETNAGTGVWQPKRYAGTYGTNGFYLNFSDNSNNTATTIGKDYSGNGNNWTPNNISVTAGVTYDSMLDVPTPYADGGNGRGNYATLNPLQAGVAPSDGNLKITGATAHRNVLSTQYLPASGLFYFEGFAPAIQRISFGLATSAFSLTADAGSSSVFIGCYGDSSLLRVWDRGTNIFSLSSVAANDVFQIAIDCATGKAWFGRNNTWYNSTGATTGNPSAGTNQTFTITNPTDYAAELGVYDASSNSHINFGQRPFTYTPPTGFKALNTQNLPDATIKKGNLFFDASLYTGTNATQSIVNSGGFQPDLVWMKARSSALSNTLTDALRGVSTQFFSNLTNAETTEAGKGLTAFNANGFTLGPDLVATGSVNANAVTYVGWQWKKGATPGVDIVTYTGNGTSQNISHSLNVAPRLIIVKNRATVSNWCVWHGSFGTASNTDYLFLQTTGAKGGSGSLNFWNNTPPTPSVFTVGSDSNTNNSGQSNVAYLFAEVAGFSKFGSYTGNGSADGPFVFLGFRPRFVIIKSTSNVGGVTNWTMIDTSRSTYNVTAANVYANASSAEDASTYIDVTSNGFKVRNSFRDVNDSGGTLIYAAFAENPFKHSLAR